MLTLTSPAGQVLIAVCGAAGMLLFALLQPEYLLLLLPLMVLTLGALAMYQFPQAIVALLVLTYGIGLDIQLDGGMFAGSGGATAALGAAVVKVVPFALAGALLIRYGPASAINWPFLAFTVIAVMSIVILPIGRIVSNAEMVRSFIGSTAPFVLAFAMAPKRIWTTVIRGATLVPIISAFTSLLTTVAGLYPAMDLLGRFQGMHTAPFLAGFCSTAIFAAMLEYLRGFKLRWIIIAGMNLAILLATQARAPLGAVILFMLCIFLLSDNKLFPMKRKVDLVMGSMVPGLLLLGPVLVFALGRFVDQGSSSSGRDLMWPYFIEAIEAQPLFGFGLGAGKLLVNPDDPLIKLLGSTAAHNEYLRLSVDGGIIGCALIFIALIAWIWGGSRNLAPAEKLVLRAALAGVLLHSGFDNTLIATTSVMQFCLFGAILARGRAEAKQGLRGQTPHGRGSVRHAADTLTWRQPRPGVSGMDQGASRPAVPRSRERRLDLDRARGIAILLVVFGHVVAQQAPEGNTWYEPVRFAIYRFHMPFFLYLSGTVVVLSGLLATAPPAWPAALRKRAVRLLVPFFGIGLFILAAKLVALQLVYVDNPPEGLGGGLRDLFLTTARSPALSVWYLLVLFLCTIVALLLRRLGSTGLVLLGLALQFLEVPPLVYLDRFASHFLFFAAGLWVAERQGRMLPAFEAWQPLWWAAFALGIAAAELEWLDARWSMVLCGLLCIPALHGAIRRPPVSAWQWPLALGRYAMAIYLFNTLAIGGGKAVLIAGGIGWTEAWFPLHVAVAMAFGLGVPVLLKRLVLRRIPAVDRLTD